MFDITLASLILYSSLSPSHVLGFQLPKPRGPFEVGTTSFELTDHSRSDPLPQPSKIALSNSLYTTPLQTAVISRSPYIFLPLLPTTQRGCLEPDLEAFETSLVIHARLDAPILNGGRNSPVVLFSPGLGVTRLIYATFAQNLASEGYAVASIDHPMMHPSWSFQTAGSSLSMFLVLPKA